MLSNHPLSTLRLPTKKVVSPENRVLWRRKTRPGTLYTVSPAAIVCACTCTHK